jgi:hypothetical protein
MASMLRLLTFLFEGQALSRPWGGWIRRYRGLAGSRARVTLA